METAKWLYAQLCAHKSALVPFEMIDTFVEVCQENGIIPNGGAFNKTCNAQYFYI